jgi:hypothetical protein
LVSGYEWIGWRNESFPYGKPVEMVFEFDRVRNFTAMHLHINNYYSKDIQVSHLAETGYSTPLNTPR